MTSDIAIEIVLVSWINKIINFQQIHLIINPNSKNSVFPVPMDYKNNNDIMPKVVCLSLPVNNH